MDSSVDSLCGLRACYVGCDDLGICQQACTSSILYHHCDGGTDGVPNVVLCIQEWNDRLYGACDRCNCKLYEKEARLYIWRYRHCRGYMHDTSGILLPVHIEQVTEINALSTTLCSFIVTVISLFLITALGSAQQRRQKERLEAMTEQLRSAADHDALTGLYNRRYLNHYMEKIMGAAHADFYTALMDLDFFKKINDKYGHLFGDEVLIGFADIMNRYLPDDGISVRFGGEEFLLVLPQMTEEQVRDLLEKMRQDYKAFGRQKCGEDFTFSCGIERYVADMEITALFSRADDKLYQAKQKGRDCVV